MRLSAALLAVLLAFVLVTSAGYIIAESDHDCTGEHCPICCQIAACENTLKQLSLAVVAVAVAAALTYVLLPAAAVFTAESRSRTPVSLKVKLSD